MNVTLFKKCLGFNDARAFGSFKMVTDPRDPNVGSAELIDCLNLTTTPDGCMEKIAHFETALTHSAPITNISAGKRFIYQDGTDTKEWDGTNVATIGLILDGPIVHTPIDVRLSHNDATTPVVLKSTAAGSAFQTATVGTNPNPETSKPFYAMPAFNHAFVYNAKMYSINKADPRFLQYSEDYHYDLFALGDSHIGHIDSVIQAGAIPGAMIAAHSFGVVVYAGTGPHDYIHKAYRCAFIDNTLFSGLISKVYGYSHVFLCDDGVYAVGHDGNLSNLTVDQTDHLDTLNNSYYCSTVQAGKYLAFGDLCTLEYDFKTKTLLKRASFGVKAATVWNGVNYFATGSTVATMGAEIDTTANFACSMTLPYSDLSAPGTKSIEALYFTGTMTGEMLITATDQDGEYWEVEVSEELLAVSSYRIKTPRRMMGNHLSFKVECASGAFRIEELRATFSASKRSK